MSEASATTAAPTTESSVPLVTPDKVFDEVPGFKVFIGNLAYSTTDEGLRAFFAPLQDDLLTAQVTLLGTRSAGYGFVTFRTKAAANKAIELLDMRELDGRPVLIALAEMSEQEEDSTAGSP